MYKPFYSEIKDIIRDLRYINNHRAYFAYKRRNFMDWVRRHPITILMISYDPVYDNEYHKYEASMDEVKLHSKKGIYRKVLTFTAKAKMTWQK